MGPKTKQKVGHGSDGRLVKPGGAVTGGIGNDRRRKKMGRRVGKTGGDVPPGLELGRRVKVRLKLFAGADIREHAGCGERLPAPDEPGW